MVELVFGILLVLPFSSVAGHGSPNVAIRSMPQTNKTHLIIDLRIARCIVARLAGVLGPDAVELFRYVFAARFPPPRISFSTVHFICIQW